MFRRIINWVKSLFYKGVKGEPPKVTVPEYKERVDPFEYEQQTMYPPLLLNAQVVGGTVDQRQFFRSAMSIMFHVLNSTAFQDEVLDFHGYIWNKGDSSRDIYKKFLSGKDVYEKYADGEMDIFVTLYYNKFTSTVGYTYPNTRKQWLNWKFVSTNRIEGMAHIIGNVVHEYMHNMGYGHTSKWSKDRWRTVPYYYGSTAKKVAIALMTSNVENGDSL